MIIKTKKNILNPDLFSRSINEINDLLEKKELKADAEYYRLCHNNHYWFTHLHHKVILPLAKDLIGHDKIKPSYNLISYYNRPYSICPPHTDRPQCKYTLDICLMAKKPWPIFVGINKYILEVNDGLFYSGTDHFHWRERIKPENGIVCMAFFHFVKSDFDGSLD